jgi:hypothetical protein
VTADVVPPQVVRFVRDVRAALDDLAPEEVDELTDGLAADLADATGADGLDALGDPRRYADELRAAAGLPACAPRRAPSGGNSLAVIAALDRRALDAGRGWLARQQWWPAVRDFLVDVRPAWWVLRGWAFWQLVRPSRDAMGHVLPTSAASCAVMAVFVVTSVQLGRRSVRVRGGRRVVLAAVNVLAVVCLVAGLTVVTADPEPSAEANPTPTSMATP